MPAYASFRQFQNMPRVALNCTNATGFHRLIRAQDNPLPIQIHGVNPIPHANHVNCVAGRKQQAAIRRNGAPKQPTQPREISRCMPNGRQCFAVSLDAYRFHRCSPLVSALFRQATLVASRPKNQPNVCSRLTTAGPSRMMNTTGKIKMTVGIIILTGAFAAFA